MPRGMRRSVAQAGGLRLRPIGHRPPVVCARTSLIGLVVVVTRGRGWKVRRLKRKNQIVADNFAWTMSTMDYLITKMSRKR